MCNGRGEIEIFEKMKELKLKFYLVKEKRRMLDSECGRGVIPIYYFKLNAECEE